MFIGGDCNRVVVNDLNMVCGWFLFGMIFLKKKKL